MIIVDSREKHWEHIRKYFDENHIEYQFPVKLDTGDYIDSDNNQVIIDRKANLQEICGNLSQGKGNIVRFTNECKRAKIEHKRFVVLIEGTNCRCEEDLAGWKSKYSKHTGKWLQERMFEMSIAYGVEWQFCRKNETAKKILEILKYGSGRD